MYLSNNYVDINIYPLTMNVMRLWACLYGKGAISNDNIIIIIMPLHYFSVDSPSWQEKTGGGLYTYQVHVASRSGACEK